MELGRRIAEIRKEHDLTQEGLAEICSVTRQTISNWENGKSYPDLETLVLISDTFGVSLDALLKGDRKMVSEITKEQKHGRSKILKAAIALAAVVIVVFAFLCYDETHESYLPYEKSGISVSDSGGLSTRINYKEHYYYGNTDYDGGEFHIVIFEFLSGNMFTRIFGKKSDDRKPLVMFVEESFETQIKRNGAPITKDVFEYYYLPEKYVKEYGLIGDKHAVLIPPETSQEEAEKLIEQLKVDSILILKSE